MYNTCMVLEKWYKWQNPAVRHLYFSALLVVYGTVGFNKIIPLHAELHMYNIGTCSKVMVLLEKCYKFQRTLKSTAANDSLMLVLRMSTPFMCTSLTKFNLQILRSLSLCAFRCFARKTFPSCLRCSVQFLLRWCRAHSGSKYQHCMCLKW